MFFRILQKEMLRKRTMNIIMLIFIILATTFISSSVNNLVSISTALDNYFKKAGLSDYVVIAIANEDNDKAITSFLNRSKWVNDWVLDDSLFVIDENIRIKNGLKYSSNIVVFNSCNVKQQKFFDSSNNVITKVNDGEIYLPLSIMEEFKLSAGDSISLVKDDFSMDFTIAGNFKDAFLGASMVGVERFIVSDKDFKALRQAGCFIDGKIYSIDTTDIHSFEQEFNRMGFSTAMAGDQALIATAYIMDMVIAGILLVVSICLILISLVILRFTIIFTLHEEFREIGVMKAIGIRNHRIRRLYLIKYLAMSIAGAALGFILSIPFGKLFLKQVSKNIIIAGSAEYVFINLALSLFIIAIVVSFCYLSTRRIRKMTPVDAIRNGSTGERYRSKSLIKLSKTGFSAIFFMAVNDILSNIKRFAVLILTFTLGTILVIVPVNTVNTLKSEKIVSWLSMAEADLYMIKVEQIIEFMTHDGREKLIKYLDSVQATLSENGIDASVSSESCFNVKISKGEKISNVTALQGTNISADMYSYTLGMAPLYENEIAITAGIADEIGAGIGDTVIVKTRNDEGKYIVTGIYQTLNNLGKEIRFSEKANPDYGNCIGGLGVVQIRYNDKPGSKAQKERYELIVGLYPDYEIYTGSDYVENILGNIAGQVDAVRKIIVVIIILINMLVTILMVKSFLTKEKGEIGMLKSLGFNNQAIIRWQVLRIGLILICSTLLGTILSGPVARISSGEIFEMMGAGSIDFVIKPLEVFCFYPLVIMLATCLVASITALGIRKVNAFDTINMD